MLFYISIHEKKNRICFILEIRGSSSPLAGNSYIPLFQYQVSYPYFSTREFLDLHLEASKTEGWKKLWNKKFPEDKKLLIPEFPFSPCCGENPPDRWPKTCVNLPSDSIGYLVNDNAARDGLWEDSYTLICFWSCAGSLAALWALGNLEMQNIACFWMCCHAGTDAFVMATKRHNACVCHSGAAGLRGVVVMTAHGSLGWLYWVTVIFQLCLFFSPVLLLGGSAVGFIFYYSDSDSEIRFKRGRHLPLLLWTLFSAGWGITYTEPHSVIKLPNQYHGFGVSSV